MDAPTQTVQHKPARRNTEALVALVSAIPELRAHAARVGELATGIVSQYDDRLDSPLELTVQAAYLHDLGKLSIPTEILEKPGALSVLEYAIVKRHPEISDAVASAMGINEPVSLAIRHHHEWWNGGGYPDGLSGESIPYMARVIAVADAFDAMTSNRPYRSAMSVEEAFAELERGAGTQFDPQIVPYLIRHVRSGAGGGDRAARGATRRRTGTPATMGRTIR